MCAVIILWRWGLSYPSPVGMLSIMQSSHHAIIININFDLPLQLLNPIREELLQSHHVLSLQKDAFPVVYCQTFFLSFTHTDQGCCWWESKMMRSPRLPFSLFILLCVVGFYCLSISIKISQRKRRQEREEEWSRRRADKGSGVDLTWMMMVDDVMPCLCVLLSFTI